MHHIGKHTSTKAKGTVIITGPEAMVEGDTLQCVHCQRHWVVRVRSGIHRGFCTNCMGPTCGQQKCVECVPFEKKLDLYEAGKIASL